MMQGPSCPHPKVSIARAPVWRGALGVAWFLVLVSRCPRELLHVVFVLGKNDGPLSKPVMQCCICPHAAKQKLQLRLPPRMLCVLIYMDFLPPPSMLSSRQTRAGGQCVLQRYGCSKLLLVVSL